MALSCFCQPVDGCLLFYVFQVDVSALSVLVIIKENQNIYSNIQSI